jgi:hypothetical protein
MHYRYVIGNMSRLARTLAVGTLALVLVSAAGARTDRTLGKFCGTVEGADWVAKRQEASGFVGTFGGSDYWVWRNRVGCRWAGQKVVLLTRVLGTKKLHLGETRRLQVQSRAARTTRTHLVAETARRSRGMLGRQAELRRPIRMAADDPALGERCVAR